jgi:hypothetical protein
LPFFNDPVCLDGPLGSPAERFAFAVSLRGTPGESYVEKRGIPIQTAETAGVRFDPNFNGRPALIAALHNIDGSITSVHARYLQHARHENKMLTIGPGGGLLTCAATWKTEPVILVEGLFDALSLAVCGWTASATIGRWAPWLPDFAAGKTVWIGFDATHSGESDSRRYRQLLPASDVRRLPPPPLCKDWNTALRKRGRISVSNWLKKQLGECSLQASLPTPLHLS